MVARHPRRWVPGGKEPGGTSPTSSRGGDTHPQRQSRLGLNEPRAPAGRNGSVPIVPDTKDWTWVLDKRCDECSFDAGAFPLDELPEMIRSNAREWRPLLQHPHVAEQPSDDRWSGLEYACHVRDVFRLYDYRLHLMLDEDDPSYPNWDQDQAAIGQNYGGEDPAKVTNEIEVAGDTLADSFASVEGGQWERTGTRSDGARFTVESFARDFVHDPIHHLHDVRLGYARLEDRA